MKKSLFWVVIGIFFLAGCSSLPPQQNVTLEPDIWDKKPKIGVYINPTPKITTSFPGANCLLCFECHIHVPQIGQHPCCSNQVKR